jgi:hypothetical protein
MKTTQNLGLRKPDPEDFYDVGDFNYNADVLDAEVTAVKNQVTNHRHTGAEGDAPPIGLDGIDAAAKTTPGGTEPNRLAMTDANGRVGAARVADTVGGMTEDDVLCLIWMGV